MDIIGKKFTRLLVLDEYFERTKSGHKKYVCKCDCGNTHIVSGESIKKGASKSCGCLRKEYIPNTFNKNRKNQILIQLYKTTIIKRSKTKGWINYIDFKTFVKLSLSNCNYCGLEPILKINDRKRNKDKTPISSEFIYVNGIDRIDSNIGYVDGNIVSCCKHCNIAKNTMTNEEFVKWIKRLYEHYIK